MLKVALLRDRLQFSYWAEKYPGKTLGILILIPILLLMIPLEGIEAHPAPCLFRTLFDIKCIGCGMTRAMLSAMHMQWHRAINHNVLVVIVFPLICFLYGRVMLQVYWKYNETLKNRRRVAKS